MSFVLERYTEKCKVGLVLYHMLESLSPAFIARRALAILALIRETDDRCTFLCLFVCVDFSFILYCFFVRGGFDVG